MVSIRPDEISAILKQQIEDYDKSVSVSNVGSVLQVLSLIHISEPTRPY